MRHQRTRSARWRGVVWRAIGACGCSLMFLLPSTIAAGHLLQDDVAALARKCGSELDWATDWSVAASTARRQNRVVLVFIQIHADFRAIVEGPLMDQDIVRLVQEHCVPLRYQPGMDAPVNSYQHYGIGPRSFGSTILIVRPDGMVLADLLGSRMAPFRDFLLRHLPPLTRVRDLAAFSKLDREARLSRLVARGHLQDALNELVRPRTADEFLLKANVLRLLLRGDEALREIERSRELDAETAEPRASILESTIRLRMRRPHRALKAIESATILPGDHARLPQALFLKGAALAAGSGNKPAANVWIELLKRFPRSRWAWQAAGLMSRSAFQQGTPPILHWPSGETIDFLRSPPPEVLPADRLKQARRDVVEYLIRHQRSDGCWRSAPDELEASLYRTDSLRVAVTAVSARALLPHRRDPRVRKAATAAVTFTRSWAEAERIRGVKPFLYDYSAWGYAYALRLFADAVREGLVDRDDLEPAVDALIGVLKRMQMDGGGWNYRVATIVGGRRQLTNQSASFMTATVILALLDVREAGFVVPEQLLTTSLDCLARCRGPRGVFEYFLTHDAESRRTALEEGAAGRGPVCTLALLRGGKGSPDAVRQSLDLFMKYRGRYARETGKSLMHAAPGGQGSHYLLFDYAWAAEACGELPEGDRAMYQTRLRELVLRTHRRGGAFLDNPINGVHYGAAMALEAINLLSSDSVAPKGEP